MEEDSLELQVISSQEKKIIHLKFEGWPARVMCLFLFAVFIFYLIFSIV